MDRLIDDALAKVNELGTVGAMKWLAKAVHAAQQAEIDRLMLEFCPNEMSKEQMATWEASQRVVSPEELQKLLQCSFDTGKAYGEIGPEHLLPNISEGYRSGLIVSDPSKISLYYDTVEQAEKAFAAITDLIDAQKEPT